MTIKPAATHRGAADFVEVSAAHVEPFRLLQVHIRHARHRISGLPSLPFFRRFTFFFVRRLYMRGVYVEC